MTKLKFCLLFILTFVCSTSFALPCHQHINKTEEVICQNKSLLYLDSQLNHEFKVLRSKILVPEPLIDDQLFWIKHVRDNCQTQACIKEVYTTRINEFKTYATKITPNNSVLGTYTYQHHVDAFNSNGEGLISKSVKDTMILSVANSKKIKFSVLLNGATGNVCELQGDAYLKGQIYQVITTDKACKLSLSFTQGFVQLHDYKGRCRIEVCGYRLGLDGVIFLRGHKNFKNL